MYIVLGLGNPGSEYENTRHNLGFRVVDRLASENKQKFRVGSGAFLYAFVKNTLSNITPFLIAKPLTFMNMSGIAAQDLLLAFNENVASLIVVHDDVDLDFGTVRVKRDGGGGGHKGVESIINSVGSLNFFRVKMGIGRPTSKDEVVDYVLTPFRKEEREIVDNMIVLAMEVLLDLISKGFEYSANKYNGR